MITKWKKIKEKDFAVGYRKIVKKTFQLPDKTFDDFDIKNEGLAACVLAFTKENKVLLVEQFRPGPEKILLELPGGYVEKNEKPLDAIKREMLEESGYTGDFKFVSTSLSCAYSNRIKYNFVATNCYKINEPQLDTAEFAQTIEMSLDDFKNHIKTCNLTDTDTAYLGLDFLKLL